MLHRWPVLFDLHKVEEAVKLEHAATALMEAEDWEAAQEAAINLAEWAMKMHAYRAAAFAMKDLAWTLYQAGDYVKAFFPCRVGIELLMRAARSDGPIPEGIQPDHVTMHELKVLRTKVCQCLEAGQLIGAAPH